MTLGKNQKAVIEFLEKGFASVTKVGLPEDYRFEREEVGDIAWGSVDIGVGRCVWARFREDDVQVNMSLSRYSKEIGPRMREMNLKVRDYRLEVPRVRVHLSEFHGTLDSLIEDLEHAHNFLATVERTASRRKYDKGYPMFRALTREFPRRRFSRYVGSNHTDVGRFEDGLYQGVYVTVPGFGMSGPEYGALRESAHVARKALGKILSQA